MIGKVENGQPTSLTGTGIVVHDTMEEYEALSRAEKMDGNIHRVLGEEPINANIVKYKDGVTVKTELDNVEADLKRSVALNTTAKNVHEAINEHESDISALNANLSAKADGTWTFLEIKSRFLQQGIDETLSLASPIPVTAKEILLICGEYISSQGTEVSVYNTSTFVIPIAIRDISLYFKFAPTSANYIACKLQFNTLSTLKITEVAKGTGSVDGITYRIYYR